MQKKLERKKQAKKTKEKLPEKQEKFKKIELILEEDLEEKPEDNQTEEFKEFFNPMFRPFTDNSLLLLDKVEINSQEIDLEKNLSSNALPETPNAENKNIEYSSVPSPRREYPLYEQTSKSAEEGSPRVVPMLEQRNIERTGNIDRSFMPITDSRVRTHTELDDMSISRNTGSEYVANLENIQIQEIESFTNPDRKYKERRHI